MSIKNLDDYRQEIDDIDAQILEAIANRVKICQEIGHFKKLNGIPMMQPDRVKIVLQKAAERGETCGLRKPFVEKLYRTIHEEVFALEDDIIDG